VARWLGRSTLDSKVAGLGEALPLSGNNLGQVFRTYVPLSPSSIIRYWSNGSDALRWEGNRRSSVALTIGNKSVPIQL